MENAPKQPDPGEKINQRFENRATFFNRFQVLILTIERESSKKPNKLINLDELIPGLEWVYKIDSTGNLEKVDVRNGREALEILVQEGEKHSSEFLYDAESAKTIKELLLKAKMYLAGT